MVLLLKSLDIELTKSKSKIIHNHPVVEPKITLSSTKKINKVLGWFPVYELEDSLKHIINN